MFGYEPGKVISEQHDSSEDGIFSNLDDNELEGVLDAILDTEKSDYTHLANSKDDEDEKHSDDEEDFEEEDEVIYEIEVEEGFDSPEMKDFRDDKDFSTKEFKKIPKGVKPNMNTVDRDDSITTGKYINNLFDDYLDDADLSWLDESWDEE